jgi:hypothetical protein
MRYRGFRRRLSERAAVFGPLDAITLVVGLALLVAAGLCAWGTIVVLAHWRDPDLGFAYGPNVVIGVKVLVLLLFPVLGFAMLAAAWALAGDQVKSVWRWMLRRRSAG